MLDNDNRSCCLNNNMISCPEQDTCISNCNVMNRANCDCKKATREELIMKIRGLKFAIVELALYLDTHPNDEKAICLHKEYSKKYRDLSDKYQKVYGPLTIEFPCNKWRWLEDPWPWERGNY